MGVKMKLKYYLRGLGIGILVTVLVMGAGLGGSKETLSDEEVRQRALELGMVDSVVLAEMYQRNAPLESNQAQESKQAEVSKPADKGVDSNEPITENDILDNADKNNKNTEEETDSEETVSTDETTDNDTPISNVDDLPERKNTDNTIENEADTGEMVSITIQKGDNSWSVSKALVSAGIVEDVNEYDQFLCDNGYAKSIIVGTYEIAIGSSYEQIAKIITKKQ